MDIISIMNKIKESKKDNDYKNMLIQIDNYFNSKGSLTFEILSDYIECLIIIGNFKEALKYIDILKNNYFQYCNKFVIANKYIKCLKADKIDELKSFFDIDSYYHLAITCYYTRQYNKAIELFNYFINNSNDQKKIKSANKYVEKIKLYSKKLHLFREIDYYYFKYLGLKLQPGHIIGIDKLRYKYIENQDNNDPKAINRPYMVWKVVEGKIYAFALSTSSLYSGKYQYLNLSKKDYPQYEIDRKITNTLVCIDELDITNVSDKVNQRDFTNNINNVYYSVCLNKNISKKKYQLFITEMSKNIKVSQYDIIAFKDFTKNEIKLYFVLNCDNQKNKYKVIEVAENQDEYEIIGTQTIPVSDKVNIIRVIELEPEKRSKLIDKVPNNFKNVNMLGKVIYHNSKMLLVMIEKEDCYVCIEYDFYNRSTLISVELVRKDIPLNIVNRVSNEIFQNKLNELKFYMSMYANELAVKKKLLTK